MLLGSLSLSCSSRQQQRAVPRLLSSLFCNRVAHGCLVWVAHGYGWRTIALLLSCLVWTAHVISHRLLLGMEHGQHTWAFSLSCSMCMGSSRLWAVHDGSPPLLLGMDGAQQLSLALALYGARPNTHGLSPSLALCVWEARNSRATQPPPLLCVAAAAMEQLRVRHLFFLLTSRADPLPRCSSIAAPWAFSPLLSWRVAQQQHKGLPSLSLMHSGATGATHGPSPSFFALCMAGHTCFPCLVVGNQRSPHSLIGMGQTVCQLAPLTLFYALVSFRVSLSSNMRTQSNCINAKLDNIAHKMSQQSTLQVCIRFQGILLIAPLSFFLQWGCSPHSLYSSFLATCAMLYI